MPERFASVVGAERAALLGFLAGLSPADWDRPTVCIGWTVKDVVAHLVESELAMGRVYRGEATETPHTDADNEAGVERWRRADHEAVRVALWQHGTATQRVIESRSDEAWRRPIDAFGARELRGLLRIHFFDLAVHSHDVTSAVGVGALWGDRVRFLVEFLVRAAPMALTRNGLPPEGSLGVRVLDVGAWTIAGTKDGWQLSDDAGPPGAALTCDPEPLALVTTGRLALSDALGRSTVEGDEEAAARILSAWRVV